MGVRAAYKVNDALTVNYWLDNGTQQTEAFNNYKDELFGFVLTPRKSISWTVNYYLGQEHPDVVYFPYSNPPGLPTLQGISFQPIVPAPKGKTHILDSYATWQPTDKWTLALEGDYVIERDQTNSAPIHTAGGAFYARYQLTKKFALAGRSEYLSDRGGLYSGTTQALKESTLTTEYKVAEGHDDANRVASRFFESAVFFDGRARIVEQAADHGDDWSGVVVREEDRGVVICLDALCFGLRERVKPRQPPARKAIRTQLSAAAELFVPAHPVPPATQRNRIA